ncbi:MAG: Panacea domain-containing protein [bacterium]
MTYDATQIANWFVKRTHQDGNTMSIMSILKLTYIAHGWYLESKKSPLFSNRIEAWQYGPVIPDVYNAFRSQGINVSKPVREHSSQISNADEEYLERIYDIYGNLSAFQLSDLTHVVGGPWDIATKTGGYYAPIPDELIKQHYVHKRIEANRAVQNG